MNNNNKRPGEREENREKKRKRIVACDAPPKQLAPYSFIYALKVNESQDKDVEKKNRAKNKLRATTSDEHSSEKKNL